MPERIELAIEPRANTAPVSSVGSALQREAELLRDGLGTGIVNRANEMWNSPGETLLSLSACAVAGGALNLASRAGGRWASASRVAGVVLTTSFGVDLARRAVPTLGAMSDTWSNPDMLKASKETVAKYAGSALADYPLMMAIGYGGFRAAGQIPVRTNRLRCTELSPKLTQDNGRSSAQNVPIESEIPINAIKPGDRTAAFIAETAKHPAVRLAESGAQINALASKHPAVRLAESGTQANSTRHAAAKIPEIAYLPRAESAAAIAKTPDLGASATNFCGAATGPARSKLNFAASESMGSNYKIMPNLSKSSRLAFSLTVVPFDLIVR